MKIHNLSALVAVLSLTAITCFSSCSTNDNQVVLDASVIAVNAAQASAPQDVYVDNAKVNTSAIGYTQSSGYLIVSSGVTHSLQFKTSSTAAVNVSRTISFSSGGYYTLYYTDNNTALVFQNDRTVSQNATARVRFINLSSAMTANADFAINPGANSLTVASAVPYQAVSSYYEVNGAANTFTFSASGSSTVLLTIPVTLQAGKIYTVVISGSTTANITYTLIAES